MTLERLGIWITWLGKRASIVVIPPIKGASSSCYRCSKVLASGPSRSSLSRLHGIVPRTKLQEWPPEGVTSFPVSQLNPAVPQGSLFVGIPFGYSIGARRHSCVT